MLIAGSAFGERDRQIPPWCLSIPIDDAIMGHFTLPLPNTDKC